MASAITVVIPTHNRRETVVLALETALGQTRPPDRVIVVADGCTDGTPDAVRALGDARVEVLDLPKGPGSSASCSTTGASTLRPSSGSPSSNSPTNRRVCC
jgi:glycosyltransferase involved in cell wall biosynthesis